MCDARLRPNEVQRFEDVLYFVVEEGKNLAVDMKWEFGIFVARDVDFFRCRGTETTIVGDEDLSVIDFGTQYTIQSITKELVLKNLGRKTRTVTWLVRSTTHTAAIITPV